MGGGGLREGFALRRVDYAQWFMLWNIRKWNLAQVMLIHSCMCIVFNING